MTSTWTYTLDAFESEIELPMRPIQSISSVSYVDTDGNTQTLAASGYQFDATGRLKPSYGNTWPNTQEGYGAVTVTYIAGATHAGNVPNDIKHAMKLIIGSFEQNREDHLIGTTITTIPNSAKNLLAPHRVVRL